MSEQTLPDLDNDAVRGIVSGAENFANTYGSPFIAVWEYTDGEGQHQVLRASSTKRYGGRLHPDAERERRMLVGLLDRLAIIEPEEADGYTYDELRRFMREGILSGRRPTRDATFHRNVVTKDF